MEEKAKSVVPTSLFSSLSKLKCVIEVVYGTKIDAERINKNLNKKCADYQPHQAPVFTKDQIREFLQKEDDKFLMQKIFAILGMCGALRNCEMRNIKLKEVSMIPSGAIVKDEHSWNLCHCCRGRGRRGLSDPLQEVLRDASEDPRQSTFPAPCTEW